MGTRFTRSKSLTWGPESPGMGETQEATQSPGPGEANLQAMQRNHVPMMPR